MTVCQPEFVFAPLESMPARAAMLLADTALAAVARYGHFALALSGGNSPRPLFHLLRVEPWRSLLPWGHIRVFFADERCVPPDHPMSNYGMVHEALLAHVPVAEVYRMRGEDDPETAARTYAELFAAHAPLGLHCALLGMGADGHTASLFPHSSALESSDTVTWIERPDATRITLTRPVLDSAEVALFYVTGADKTPRVRELCQGPLPGPADFPAAHIAADRRIWVLDAKIS